MLVEVFVEADFIADLGFVDVQPGVCNMRANFAQKIGVDAVLISFLSVHSEVL